MSVLASVLKMNLVGFVIVFANLYIVSAYIESDPSTWNIAQLSIQKGRVQELAKLVRNLRGYNLEGFRTDGFNMAGNVGKYLSRSLLNYMRYGYGNPRREGLIITAYFSKDLPPIKARDETLGVIIQSKDLDKDFKNGIKEHVRRIDREIHSS